MDLIDPAIQQYADVHTSPEPDVLQELDRETNLKVSKPQMLSGHLQGRLLSMLSKMMAPARILEVGTYTGYSAICLAEGLKEGGKVATIDNNEELEDMARHYFQKAGMEERIDLHIGEASTLIDSMEGPWDIVFIDADKENYSKYYDQVIDTKVRPGGLIIADNVLWKGKVIDEEAQDKDTRALRAFNEKLQQDDRVEHLLLTVRDGLMLARKL